MTHWCRTSRGMTSNSSTHMVSWSWRFFLARFLVSTKESSSSLNDHLFMYLYRSLIETFCIYLSSGKVFISLGLRIFPARWAATKTQIFRRTLKIMPCLSYALIYTLLWVRRAYKMEVLSEGNFGEFIDVTPTSPYKFLPDQIMDRFPFYRHYAMILL